jgi:adenosylmethionine-8-amino-7-oxononanoate aminotransferase
MSRIFHRFANEEPRLAVRGEGAYIVDSLGRRYLDASGGAAVSCLGHNYPSVVEALVNQARTLPYVHSAFFTTEAADELSELMVAHAPPGLERVLFVSGGSEAIEAALKLARQYFVEKGEPERRYFVARRQSFHGNTLGGLAAGGNRARRQLFEPLLMPVRHIAPCFSYRYRLSEESEAEYALRAANDLETALVEIGPGNVAAFIAETVVGATAGAVPPAPGYFRLVREICDRHGVLLILDEVMCGTGRTGTLHACEQEGVTPDLLAVAKGLGAGYQPIGALLVSGSIFAAIRDGSGSFQHGHTYMAHATACAAALAVQRALLSDGLLNRVHGLGNELQSALRSQFGEHPHVGDIRGRGLFLALELVKDRETKQPFDPRLSLHHSLRRAALDRGLLCYPMGGTVDGERGDHVLLAPPFVLERAQIDELVSKLAGSLDAAIAGTGAWRTP